MKRVFSNKFHHEGRAQSCACVCPLLPLPSDVGLSQRRI